MVWYILLNIAIALAVAALWEVVAWAMHKYVMHGFLWVLHQDHHKPTGHKLMKNDLFAIFFASVSFLLIFFGLQNGWWPMASAGFGVALYGVGYVMFHDIMFHKRVKRLKFKPKSPYFARIINAHRIHHSTITKHDASSFSFLWAPRRYDVKGSR